VAEKIANDAAAYIRSLAAQKGRNVEWAGKAVLESVSAGEQEALKQKSVEVVASSEGDLMDQLQGRDLKKLGQDRVMATKGASFLRLDPSVRESLISYLADPTLAYVLFLVGLYALIFEVAHPGVILPGVTGVICLILAFISFGSLPVNYGALALLAFGVILFGAEAVVISHGVLGVGGTVAMLLGSLLLYNSDLPAFRLSWWVILVTVGSTAAFFLLVIAQAVAALRRPKPRGASELMGREGTARTRLDPEGMVHVGSEDWSAVADGGPIPAKSRVKVVKVQGLRLVVKKL
jgi:membrane-bound serine protease (ClpP class)